MRKIYIITFSLFIQIMILYGKNVWAAPGSIELMKPTDDTTCYQETSLELGNVWTICGPFKFKDNEMDKVRLVYVKNAGSKEYDLSLPQIFTDLESGKTLGIGMPPEKKGAKGSYMSTWQEVLKSVEEGRLRTKEMVEKYK